MDIDWAADVDSAWVITLDDEGSAQRLPHDDDGKSLLLAGGLAGGTTL